MEIEGQKININIEKKRIITDLRRKQIMDVALQLFYKNGYANTKMSDIATTAGISKGLIYRYFESKENLLFAYKEQMEECLNKCKALPTPRDQIREFGRLLLADPDISGYIPPLRIYIAVFITGEVKDNDNQNPVYNDFSKNYFKPIFQEGINIGQFKKGNAEEFASIYWHCLFGYVAEWIRNPNQKIFIPDIDSLISIFEADK